MNDKTQYITPTIKVVAFTIEQGFQGTGGPRGIELFGASDPGFNNQNQQNWGEEPSNSLFNFEWGDN